MELDFKRIFMVPKSFRFFCSDPLPLKSMNRVLNFISRLGRGRNDRKRQRLKFGMNKSAFEFTCIQNIA